MDLEFDIRSIYSSFNIVYMFRRMMSCLISLRPASSSARITVFNSKLTNWIRLVGYRRLISTPACQEEEKSLLSRVADPENFSSDWDAFFLQNSGFLLKPN